MKNSVITVFICCILFACKKDAQYKPYQRCAYMTSNIDTVTSLIQGTWEWVESVRKMDLSFDTFYETPFSNGWYKKQTIIFSNDTSYWFIDNRPDTVYKFRIQRMSDLTNYPGDSLFTVITYYNLVTNSRAMSPNYIRICQEQFYVSHPNENGALYVRK